MNKLNSSQEIKDLSQDLYQFINTVVDEFGLILIGFAALGVMASSLVNYFKDFFRHRYFRYSLRRQLRRAIGVESDVNEIEQFIVTIATGQRQSFYKQELSGVFSSLSRVQNIVFSDVNIDEARAFLTCFIDENYPAIYRNDYKSEVEQLIEPADSVTPEFRAHVKGKLDAQLIGLKIKIQNSWDTFKQWSALVLAILIMLAVFRGDSTLQTIMFSVIGGSLAPFAHDLLKNLRAAKIK